MLNARIPGLVAALLFVLTAVAASDEITTEPFDPVPGDPALTLGVYTHPAGGKTLNLTVGIGSGAARSPFDFPSRFASLFRHDAIVDVFWAVSDRGPNFQCDEALAVIGLLPDVACPADGSVGAGVGRIYPRPDYSPSIYRVVMLSDRTFRIVRAIPLRTTDGTPMSGLPNPLTVATTEIPRDGTGAVIAQDASSTPSLEQITDLSSVGVTPLAKTQRLVASSLEDARSRFPRKLEGLVRALDGRLVIVNADDFGITDASTQVNLVDGLDLGDD